MSHPLQELGARVEAVRQLKEACAAAHDVASRKTTLFKVLLIKFTKLLVRAEYIELVEILGCTTSPLGS